LFYILINALAEGMQKTIDIRKALMCFLQETIVDQKGPHCKHYNEREAELVHFEVVTTINSLCSYINSLFSIYWRCIHCKTRWCARYCANVL